MAAGRMHDQPGPLVDDDQVLVLVGDRERLCRAHELGRRRSISTNRSSMPSVIEASARLNGGQPRGSLMKSVTEPWIARSTMLPSAPPTSIPVGSHISGRVACSAK